MRNEEEKDMQIRLHFVYIHVYRCRTKKYIYIYILDTDFFFVPLINVLHIWEEKVRAKDRGPIVALYFF